MEGHLITDAEIREAIKKTPISVLEHLISEYIHDERNQDLARRKIIKNEKFDPLSEEFNLTPKQCQNIIKQARRIIFDHL